MTSKVEYFQGNEWMCTFTGKHVYPLALRPEDICIEDIAHHLSLQCRYNGSTSRFYSVAEHCWVISHALEDATGDAMIALQGLVHDAAETYTGDMIRPVKNSLRGIWSKWGKIEQANEEVIAQTLGVKTPFSPLVKEFDRRIIADEKEQFGMNTWHWDQEPLDVVLIGYEPQKIEKLYLERFQKLKASLVRKAA